MKARAGLPVIGIDALRVGLYVHLDLGWMSHPFALSHFKITTADELATIRTLGLETLRWNPALSDPAPEECRRSTEGGVVPERVAGTPADPSARQRVAPQKPRTAPVLVTAMVGSAGDPEVAARERAALARCEAQFDEASQALGRLYDIVLQQPGQAKREVLALNQALLGKMAGAQDLCLRLLGESSGDRAVAHAMTVGILSLMLARSLGWGDKDLCDLGVGALLHDVGKLELPERVRQRDEHFSAAEARYYEEHVARGVAVALRMGLAPGALRVIGQHHELADRSGFPMKIGSEGMSPAARVVALVNRYDKLCNPARPHLALTPHEAVSLMFAQHRTKFDAGLLEAFVKMMGVYPPGSVVQLTDERLAMVVAVNSLRPLKPRVIVYQPGAAPGDTVTLDLEALPGLGIRRSLKPQLLHKAVREALAPRARMAYFFEPVQASARPMAVDLPQEDLSSPRPAAAKRARAAVRSTELSQ